MSDQIFDTRSRLLPASRSWSFQVDYPLIAKELITDCAVSPFEGFEKADKSKILQVKAIWDTGSFNCVINESVAEKLGIKPLRLDHGYTMTSKTKCNVYVLNLHLPNGVIIPIEVDGVTPDPGSKSFLNYDLVIGLVIMTKGIVKVETINGKTTFHFQQLYY